MSLILLIFAPLALQYERGWVSLAPLAAAFYFLSVAANYTELVLLTGDFPRDGERTFSQRLARIRHWKNTRGRLCQAVADYLNYFSPGHVK
jgi:hypothetical protein